MSTNGTHVDDTEIAECDGEKVVTMMDVLQEQQEFEEDANAVLGASDDKNCTYSKGYIKRQAVYACLTCCGDAKLDPEKRAGVCLACSLTCHENHDLVELYTKRNFCCDCGNPKFNHPCQYTQNKVALNDDNIYNQNFSGLYCVCHRPYPDPDGVEEEMIQCIVCEDWLHASHLEATVPSSELYAEMICKACMEKNEFLHDYGKYAVNGDVDVMDTSDITDSSIQCNGNTSEINGVEEKLQSDQVECTNGDAEVKKDTNPAESRTSHDDVDENKSEEQLEPMDSVSEKGDDEKLAEENNVKDAGEFKNSTENQNKDLESDVKDGINSTEIKQNESNDTNEKNISTADEISDIKLSDNVSNKDSADLGNEPPASTDTKEQSTLNNKDVKSTDHIDTNPAENYQENILNPENDIVLNTENNAISNPENDDVLSPENASLKPEKDENGKDAENEKDQKNGTEEAVQVHDQAKQEEPIDSSPKSGANTSIEIDGSSQVTADQGDEQINEYKRKLSTEESTDDVSVKKAKVCKSNCVRPQGQKRMFKGATFWPCHFRQKLCTCSECITMYKDLSVLFLIDPDDTVTAYEVLGKEKSDGTATTQYEKGLEALSTLGRIQQINALTEYNKMKDKLLDFLKSFKDRKEVVKEEDIKAFFAGMKPKREPDGVYFCR